MIGHISGRVTGSKRGGAPGAARVLPLRAPPRWSRVPGSPWHPRAVPAASAGARSWAHRGRLTAVEPSTSRQVALARPGPRDHRGPLPPRHPRSFLRFADIESAIVSLEASTRFRIGVDPKRSRAQCRRSGGSCAGDVTMKWRAGQEQICAVVAKIRGRAATRRIEASCLIRLFALCGAWVDPSVSCNRRDEVSPSSEDGGRLCVTLAVITFGQLVSVNLRRRAGEGSTIPLGPTAKARRRGSPGRSFHVARVRTGFRLASSLAPPSRSLSLGAPRSPGPIGPLDLKAAPAGHTRRLAPESSGAAGIRPW